MAAKTSAIDWSELSIGMLGGDKREQEIALGPFDFPGDEAHAVPAFVRPKAGDHGYTELAP